MARLLVIPVALFALLAGAIALSGGGTRSRADFTFISARDVYTLDTNQMSYLQDFRLAYIIWDGLYSYDGMTLKPIPAVAYKTDVSPDKCVFVFHLRPEAVWSNGDPVTANDFAFAWRRMLESPGEYTYLHYYVKGAEAYLKAYQDYLNDPTNKPKPDFKTVGEEVIDAHTFKVTLTDPVTFFFDLMAFPPFYPLNKKSMQLFAKRDPKTGNVTYDGRFTRPGVVGNGAFNLTEWDFKRRVRLEKSKTYWDRDNVKSNSIEMLVVEDTLGQFLRYEAGDVDWLPNVPSEIGPKLIEQKREDLRLFSGFGSYFLTCNSLPKFKNGDPNPLADMRVRQALAMGFDREPIVKNITRMGEKPASTYIPPDIFPGFKVAPGFTFDPTSAKKLLADAGIKGSKLSGVRFLVRSSSPVEADMVQSIVNQWKSNIGLDIDIELIESKIARQRINDKDYGIAVADWIGDYPDPSTFTDKYRSNSVNNDSGWINLEYDGLLDQAAKEADPQKRYALLEKANRMLDVEVPIIPLYYITNQYLFRDNVHGINVSPRNMTMLKGVWVDHHDSVAAAGGKD
jgi:oligopeptide transport system substrate-binding protein